MKTTLLLIIIFIISANYSFADFKKIKKKATITQPEIIFPLPKNLDKCKTKLYVNPELNKVEPLLKVKAPSGYGLDDRYNYALDRFSNFLPSIPAPT